MTHDGTRDAEDAPRPGLQPPVLALPAPHERASAAGQPPVVRGGTGGLPGPTTTAVPALAQPAGAVADPSLTEALAAFTGHNPGAIRDAQYPPRPRGYKGRHRIGATR